MKTPTTWVEGVEVFLILEPNIIVVDTSKFDSNFCRYHFNTSNTQKLGQLSNKNTWKNNTHPQKPCTHPRNLKMVGWKPYTKGSPHPVEVFPVLGSPLLQGIEAKVGFHLVLHDGRTSKPWRVTWGLVFGPVKPVGCFRNHQENHRLDGAKNPCKEWENTDIDRINWWFLESIEVLGVFIGFFADIFVGEKILPKN